MIETGNEKVLERLARVHANFSENFPFTFLLIARAEMRNIRHIVIHLRGIVLLIGWSIYASGGSNSNENFQFRVIGIVFTLNTIAAAALANATSYFLTLITVCKKPHPLGAL